MDHGELGQLVVVLFEFSRFGRVVDLPGQPWRVEHFLEDRLESHFVLDDAFFGEFNVLAQNVFENEVLLFEEVHDFVFAKKEFVFLEGFFHSENWELDFVHRAKIKRLQIPFQSRELDDVVFLELVLLTRL